MAGRVWTLSLLAAGVKHKPRGMEGSPTPCPHTASDNKAAEHQASSLFLGLPYSWYSGIPEYPEYPENTLVYLGIFYKGRQRNSLS